MKELIFRFLIGGTLVSVFALIGDLLFPRISGHLSRRGDVNREGREREKGQRRAQWNGKR
jgi:hypothetical protein